MSRLVGLKGEYWAAHPSHAGKEDPMVNQRTVIWVAALAVLYGGATSWGGVKKVESEGMHCYSGEAKAIKFSTDHWAFSYELFGTRTDRTASDDSGNMSTHCVGTVTFDRGKEVGDSFCEFVDKDGDKYVFTGHRTGPKGEFVFIAGTGKWAGIAGGGTYEPVGAFPTIAPGRLHGCTFSRGSYTLPEEVATKKQ